MPEEKNEIVKALYEKARNRDGVWKIPCASAFEVAEAFGVGRREIGDLCNREGIRVIQCQLGCFP